MRLVDFFFALRPLVLVPAWSFFLLGVGLVRHSDAHAPFPALALACFTLVMAGVYLVNQVVDQESDRINGKGFFLQRGIFTPRLYAWVAVAFLAASFAVALWQRASPGWIAMAALLGLAYSLPPVRLAARPGLDLLANAAGYGGIAVVLGNAAAGPAAVPARPWLLASTALAVGAVFVHTTLLDLEGDRRTGKRTLGVVWGAGAMRALAAVLAALALAAAGAARNPLLAIPAGVLLLMTCAAAWRPARVASRSVCVGGTLVYAAAAGLVWPPFLPALAVLVLLTRLYYRHRFGIAYPAF
jgi:4-hydroxybenzoate polyprenyltransferase